MLSLPKIPPKKQIIDDGLWALDECLLPMLTCDYSIRTLFVQLSSRIQRARVSPLINSIIVMGGYLLSRVTGLLREVAISAHFGTGAELDAYRAAFKVTDFLYLVVIGGALGSSFIPVFLQVWNHDGEERAWRLASAVTTWALLILAGCSGVLFIFAAPFTNWLWGKGFDASGLALITQLTRLFLLSPLLLGLGGLAMAALNARDRFTLPALAPAIYNIGIILGALLLAPRLGVWGLALGVVGGAALYLLVQIPALWQLGMRLQPTLGRELRELQVIARQMAPRVIGQSAAQASILVTALLTARQGVGAGQISGLDYAYQLMLLPFGIFSLSLSTVAFPRLAQLYAEGQLDTLVANVRRTLAIILFLTLPAAIALWVLGVPLVRLLFQRGAFDETSLGLTLGPLLGYASALPAFAASEILIRTFYAMQQTRPPVLIGLLQVGLNILLGSLALRAGGGTAALALAFSLANNTESLLLFLLLGRRLPGIWRNRTLIHSISASLLAALILGAALLTLRQLSIPLLPFLAAGAPYLWQRDLAALVGWLALAGAVGGALYIGVATALGSPEPRRVLGRLRRQ